MDRAELYDDPRLLLESKMRADGFSYQETKEKIDSMSDKEVDQALKPYLMAK